jgi:hypothetical protein
MDVVLVHQMCAEGSVLLGMGVFRVFMQVCLIGKSASFVIIRRTVRQGRTSPSHV